MNNVLVRPKNKKELTLIRQLMKHLNISSFELTEEMEDTAFAEAMREVDRTKFSTKEAILAKLRSK